MNPEPLVGAPHIASFCDVWDLICFCATTPQLGFARSRIHLGGKTMTREKMTRDTLITILLVVAGVLLAIVLFGAGALWKGKTAHLSRVATGNLTSAMWRQ